MITKNFNIEKRTKTNIFLLSLFIGAIIPNVFLLIYAFSLELEAYLICHNYLPQYDAKEYSANPNEMIIYVILFLVFSFMILTAGKALYQKIKNIEKRIPILAISFGTIIILFPIWFYFDAYFLDLLIRCIVP